MSQLGIGTGYPRAPTLRKLDTPLTLCDQPVPVYSLSLLGNPKNILSCSSSDPNQNTINPSGSSLLPFTPRNRLIIDNRLAKQLGVCPIDQFSSKTDHLTPTTSDRDRQVDWHSCFDTSCLDTTLPNQIKPDHSLSRSHPIPTPSQPQPQPQPQPPATPTSPTLAKSSLRKNSADRPKSPWLSQSQSQSQSHPQHKHQPVHSKPLCYVPTPSNRHMGFDLAAGDELISSEPSYDTLPHPLIQVSIIAIASIWNYSQLQSSPLNTAHLVPFITHILRRSRSNANTLKLSLFYLHQSRRAIRNAIAAAPAISPHPPILLSDMAHRTPKPSDHPVGSGRKMFLSALMCASKYLQDRNFSNRAWAKISGLPVQDVNTNERVFLGLIDYRLHVDLQAFEIWSIRLQKLMDEKGIATCSGSYTSPTRSDTTRSRPTSLPGSATSAPPRSSESAPKPLSEPHRPGPQRKVDLDLCTPVRQQTYPLLARPPATPATLLSARADHTPVRQMTTPLISRPAYGGPGAYQTPTKPGGLASCLADIAVARPSGLSGQRRAESQAQAVRPLEVVGPEIAQAERKLHETVAHEKTVLAAGCAAAGGKEERRMRAEEEARAEIRRLVAQSRSRRPEPEPERRPSVSAGTGTGTGMGTGTSPGTGMVMGTGPGTGTGTGAGAGEIAEAMERARLDEAATHRREDGAVGRAPWTRAPPTRRATQPAVGGPEPVPRIERRAMGGCGLQDWQRFGMGGREGFGEEPRVGVASMGGRARSTVGGNGPGERPASASSRGEQRAGAGSGDVYRAYRELGQGRHERQYQYQYPAPPPSLSSSSAAGGGGAEYLGYNQSGLVGHDRTRSYHDYHPQQYQDQYQHHHHHKYHHHHQAQQQNVDQRLVVGGRYGF